MTQELQAFQETKLEAFRASGLQARARGSGMWGIGGPVLFNPPWFLTEYETYPISPGFDGLRIVSDAQLPDFAQIHGCGGNDERVYYTYQVNLGDNWRVRAVAVGNPDNVIFDFEPSGVMQGSALGAVGGDSDVMYLMGAANGTIQRFNVSGGALAITATIVVGLTADGGIGGDVDTCWVTSLQQNIGIQRRNGTTLEIEDSNQQFHGVSIGGTSDRGWIVEPTFPNFSIRPVPPDTLTPQDAQGISGPVNAWRSGVGFGAGK